MIHPQVGTRILQSWDFPKELVDVPAIGLGAYLGGCVIPDGRVVGLSKLARVVESFARRFQVQEKMTAQIANCIQRAKLLARSVRHVH